MNDDINNKNLDVAKETTNKTNKEKSDQNLNKVNLEGKKISEEKKFDKTNKLDSSNKRAVSEKKVTNNVSNDSKKENQKKTSKNDSEKKDASKKQSNGNSAKNQRSGSGQSDESEFIEKLVSINRVAKVVKGGRRFSFAALVVVGDGNGLVGHGKGKAKEVPEAIKKATEEAKANLIRVPLRQARTLHHDVSGRYDAGKVYLRSAPSGTGVIAGGPMRSIFEALGIKDIVAKSVGSSNPHNMIRATFHALKSVSSPKLISIRRGLKVNEITKRRKGSSTQQEGIVDV